MSLNFLSHPFYRAFSFSIMARFFPARNLFAPLVTANSHFPCTAVAIVTIVWRGNEGETPKGVPFVPVPPRDGRVRSVYPFVHGKVRPVPVPSRPSVRSVRSVTYVYYGTS